MKRQLLYNDKTVLCCKIAILEDTDEWVLYVKQKRADGEQWISVLRDTDRKKVLRYMNLMLRDLNRIVDKVNEM